MKTSRSLAALALLLCGLAAASSASAAYFCNAKVTGLSVGPDGVVTMQAAPFNWVFMCATSATTNDVSPEACKSLLAVLLTAKTTGSTIQLAFNDALSCTTHPAWTYLTGWYWGPALLTD
ncbi:MAG TPA: hypothetical protein VE907_23745 [Gammaproteobacteria bacterium]|nr:hypothetical protein [Gammaproteobacteria bacterium]